eukprot:TRINITY_DN16281_c0_g1_i1.p1 TRINITY_DN16281_c0_g1~~TRINITY_DN16281_c0_g1_i1.p1  ORF type:complete len:648 (+),score=205.47 TRINITY_DN16281_c0_g1_i1:66-2009(+)
MGKKGFGGKKKSGGGGGKGKGKGRRKAKKNYVDASDDEGAGNATSMRGPRKGKGKGKKGKQDADDRHRPEPEAPPPPKKAKPGFGALLESFGVADSASEMEDDEADEEASDGAADAASEDEDGDMGAVDDDETAKADTAAKKGKKAAGKKKAEEEEVVDFEENLEDDEEDDEEVVVATPAEMQRVAGRAVPDYYPRFFDDPPPPEVLPVAEQGTSVSSTAAAPDSTKFTLPGLDRCEAKKRDVAALQAWLKTSSDAATCWKHCDLAPGLVDAFEAVLAKEGLQIGPKEGAFFLFLHAYLDVAFPEHTHDNGRAIRAMYMLHAADHALKASMEVMRNIKQRAKLRKVKGADVDDVLPADSGFTRARVLILCPFKSSCYELVKTLLALCPGKKEIANKSRFEEEYSPEGEEIDETKPDDWNYLFGGNDDDSFRLGITVSHKQLRLYAPFHKSDILICSPIGLRKITGGEGDKKREYDFLSSIEVCIVDRADAFRMQNWEHLVEVMQVINRKPQSLEGVDISRLRQVFADGRARDFRQTAVTAAGQSLDMESVFSMGSVAGPQVEEGALAKKFGIAAKKKNGRGGNKWGLDSDDEEEDVARSKLLGPVCCLTIGWAGLLLEHGNQLCCVMHMTLHDSEGHCENLHVCSCL